VLGDVPGISGTSDPADLVVSAHRVRALQDHVDAVLSDLETEVGQLYVEGRSYQEIAERLHRHVTSIDNALQRVRRTLEEHLRRWDVADCGSTLSREPSTGRPIQAGISIERDTTIVCRLAHEGGSREVHCAPSTGATQRQCHPGPVPLSAGAIQHQGHP